MNAKQEPSDPCRACNGTGDAVYTTGRGTRITEACDKCRGTGSRVFVIKSNKEHRAARAGVKDADGSGPHPQTDLSAFGSTDIAQIVAAQTRADLASDSRPEWSGF